MMFINQFFTLLLLFFFAGPAWSGNHLVAPESDSCCPENTTLRPIQSSDQIAPLNAIPSIDIGTVHSLAKPDAVIVPGLSAMGFSNVADVISGRVPGVFVSGGGFNNFIIRIRGALGPPLLVIDGLPFYNANDDAAFNAALQMIPPAEVASIEILKSAAQTAIYGGRGGNGVIRINTRGYLHTVK